MYIDDLQGAELVDELADAMRELMPPRAILRKEDVAATFRTIVAQISTTAVPLYWSPFCYLPKIAAEDVGSAIATTYAAFAKGPAPSLPSILAMSFRRFGIPYQAPERRAAMVAAVLASVPCSNRFHNVGHTREVLGNLIWLLQANDDLVTQRVAGAHHLSGTTVARLMLAATIHDLGHNGRSNLVPTRNGETYVPFHLEDQACRLIEPVLDRAVLEPEAKEQVFLLVRATDPILRADIRRATDHALYQHALPDTLDPRVVPEYKQMPFALCTALMCDADILSSAGLTLDYHRRTSALLAAERGRCNGPIDSLTFFTKIVGGSFASPPGKFFNGNLWRIHNILAASCAC